MSNLTKHAAKTLKSTQKTKNESMKKTASAIKPKFLKPSALAKAVAFALAVAPMAHATTAPTANTANSLVSIQASSASEAHLSITLEEPTRLLTVLDSAINENRVSHEIYWPSARIIANDRTIEIRELRANIFNQLAQLPNEIASPLREQINSWKLGYQPYGAINRYQARLDINHNPLLPAGNYTLVLPKRPDNVYLYGFTNTPGAQPFVAGTSVRHFMSQQSQNEALLPSANRGHVLLTRNDTHAKLPWAAHNAGGQQLLPGDILFVGLREASAGGLLPFGKLEGVLSAQDTAKLEDNIQALLRHVVPPVQTEQQSAQTVSAQPQHNWRALARPLQLHETNWEQQNQGSLEPFLTEHPRRLTFNNYGHIGLIQMPSARNAPAGEFALSYNDMKEYYRYTVSVQLYDWLQASAFYVRIPNRLYSNDPNFSGDSIYTDKGFDVKFRLFEETNYWPEVSVGLIDMAGTGVLSSEYIAASKAVGPFDFTLGIGFGRMGTADSISNPFCEVVNDFCTRNLDPNDFSGRGGQFEAGNWFRGDAALFAGVEYQTPIDNLRLKVEYESNDYSRDLAGVPIDPKTAFNFGLNWQLSNVIDLSLNYERGDVLTFGFNIRSNFNRMPTININPPKRDPVLADAGQEPRYPDIENVNWARLAQNIRAQRTYAYSEIYLSASESETAPEGEANALNKVTVYTHPSRLRDPQDRLDRTARVLLAELPESISEIEIVEQTSRQPLIAYSFNADDYRRRIANADPDVRPDEAWEYIERVEPTPRPKEPENPEEYVYTTPNTDDWALKYPEQKLTPSWGILPLFEQGYGSPETFMFFQLQANVFANLQVNRNFSLHSSVGVNIYNNYDKFNFTVDSLVNDVPRVRTYAREYMQADAWLSRLQANYYKALSSEWHAQLYGGYLERMFAGAGGEILYRPLNSPFAYGLDINRVRQRDFNGGFGFRDYEVTTGFASLYYDVGQHIPAMEGGLITLNAGQFLAGDKGVKVNLQRRFDSGVVIGAFAAFTNLSSEEFGEGSFNKGFFISIPFDLFSINASRSRVGFAWSPLTRDGGQMLHTRGSLWHQTDERSPYFNK
ncbi:YjbH domain-containing protein [Aliidiomarina shirensis]|uniref:YjbH domain-containing protein n=1 Tax=Aliidiomarina shirensis TaxID=1048642 RepID=A0A432WU41_9GAMM|nr:YjbH domain-containing protein [Aliidiomarina shirensis]RUO37290.1 YjbH domain-containing protein [Aliidiomarina shirensis]